MSAPRYTPLVESLPASVPFVGPETQERARGSAFDARLGANESVFGPSPRAVEAMTLAASDVWQYGDPENHDLRHALAVHHGVGADNIVVGEGIDALLGYLVRMLIHFGVNRIAQAGALAALGDTQWLASVRQRVAQARERIARIGRANGLVPLPSATNFVTLDCGRDGGHARALVAALVAEGVFVRTPFVAPQDRCIRITAGTDADLDRLEALLPRVLARL